MARRPITIIIMIITTALAGCSAMPEPVVTTQAVAVPVAVRSAPPPELLGPIVPPGPIFVAPRSRTVAVGLTDEGRAALVAYINALRGRIGGWEAWAR